MRSSGSGWNRVRLRHATPEDATTGALGGSPRERRSAGRKFRSFALVGDAQVYAQGRSGLISCESYNVYYVNLQSKRSCSASQPVPIPLLPSPPTRCLQTRSSNPMTALVGVTPLASRSSTQSLLAPVETACFPRDELRAPQTSHSLIGYAALRWVDSRLPHVSTGIVLSRSFRGRRPSSERPAEARIGLRLNRWRGGSRVAVQRSLRGP
jgi:hypothetical protein